MDSSTSTPYHNGRIDGSHINIAENHTIKDDDDDKMNGLEAYVLGQLDEIAALHRSDENTGERIHASIRSPAEKPVMSNNIESETDNSVTTTYRNTCFEAAAVKTSKGERAEEERFAIYYIVNLSPASAVVDETSTAKKCSRTLNSVPDLIISAISHIDEGNCQLDDNCTAKDLVEDERDMPVVGIENKSVKDKDENVRQQRYWRSKQQQQRDRR